MSNIDRLWSAFRRECLRNQLGNYPNRMSAKLKHFQLSGRVVSVGALVGISFNILIQGVAGH